MRSDHGAGDGGGTGAAISLDHVAIELQGTAEGDAFDRATMNQLLDLAHRGIAELIAQQKQALGIA